MFSDAVLHNNVTEDWLAGVQDKEILDNEESSVSQINSLRLPKKKKELKLIRVLEEKRLEIERENRV